MRTHAILVAAVVVSFLSVQTACASHATGPTCSVAGIEPGEAVEIREAPNPAAAVVGAIPHGASGFRKLANSPEDAEQPDWVEVQFDRTRGWVRAWNAVCAFSPDDAKQVLGDRDSQALRALSRGDMAQFARFVHPERGVRFSPYPYVDPEVDLRFEGADLPAAFADDTKRTWGAYDGSGDPIRLSFRDYFQRFVYSHDFLNAASVSFNDFTQRGNTRNNLREAYPDGIVVEFFQPGFDPQLRETTWSSLFVVFEEFESQWYVVGVVHSEWTI